MSSCKKEEGSSDSVYVETDTMVGGYVYKMVNGSLFGEQSLLRDSSGFIVDGFGNRIFTN